MTQIDMFGRRRAGRWRRVATALLIGCLCSTPACAPGTFIDGASPTPTTRTPATEPPRAATTVPPETAQPHPTTPTTAPRPIVVPYRVEVRVADVAPADFAATIRATLEDSRGWQAAGFDLVEAPDATHVIVLAEGAEVDALCLPYETYGAYSCQNGPVVALNADRWRAATPEWTGNLTTYRQMLTNHEVGHLLGQRHTECETPGVPAAVMVQQSTELHGCLPNAWPLPDEIVVAARHDRPIAPGHGE